MDELVTVEQRGAVTIVGLNEPGRRNALSTALRTDLLVALREALGDEACRAIVLTGNGGVFCAGGDIKAMGEGGPRRWAMRLQLMHDVARALAAGTKPVLAAVEGAAFGAGLSLSALADYAVAAEDATFCASFGRMGLIGDTGAMWSLPMRIGVTQTRALMMSARMVGAPEAKQMGLIDEIAPKGAALEAAVARAADLASMAPLAFAAMKTMLARSPCTLEDVLAMEMDVQVKLLMSEDHVNAREAFAAKRTPVFVGR